MNDTQIMDAARDEWLAKEKWNIREGDVSHGDAFRDGFYAALTWQASRVGELVEDDVVEAMAIAMYEAEPLITAECNIPVTWGKITRGHANTWRAKATTAYRALASLNKREG